MLSATIQDALNEQIKHEIYSANLYLSLAAYCDSINLPGFAHWMRMQYQEELDHAIKLYEHITSRNGRVVVAAIDQPPVEFAGPADVFQQALEHERKVTGLINRLYHLAAQEQDYATQVYLDWFVTEQVEEEKTASEILEQVRMAGQDGAVLLMIDRQLASRVPGGKEAP